jgi:alpha-beta hydrolase superfamily lysophospholipase
MIEAAVPASGETMAFQRAMPVTRMLDCGVDYADTQSLFQRTTAGEQWDEVAEELADRQIARANDGREAGFLVTARDAQAAGLACLIFAQMPFNFDVPRKRTLYRRIRDAGEALGQMSEESLERVLVPHAGSNLVAWLVQPAGQRARACVLLFGGQSGWGLAYLPMARALAARGIATLLAEGPGQGETRLDQALFVDIDVAAAYQAFVTWLIDERGFSSIGIWGNSFGGLWAAKTAAGDSRLRGCCVNGAFAFPKVLSFRMAAEQARAMLGQDDDAAVQANFDRMRWRPGEDRIHCPLLVLHGGSDPLIQISDQQPFINAAETGDVTFQTWADGEHTIYNHAAERTAFVSDWFVKRLAGQ